MEIWPDLASTWRVDGLEGSRAVVGCLGLLNGTIVWLRLSASHWLPLLRGIPAKYVSLKLHGLSGE